MNIYKDFFDNLQRLKTKEDRLTLVTFFVEKLHQQPKNQVFIIQEKGRYTLILSILIKYKIPHEALHISKKNIDATIFELL